MAAATMPVSVWMVDALELQPGHEVLELAAGTGEVGFLAAEQIAPGGTLISSDFVPEMITVAQARAERLGITNVRFRQIDAESIDQPAASLDGVLCRWGYMLMADGEAALRETRRILRPGARVALAAWTGAEREPVGVAPDARAGRPRPHRAARPRRARASSRGRATGSSPSGSNGAGFGEHEVDVVDFIHALSRPSTTGSPPSATSRAASARRSTASTRPSATTCWRPCASRRSRSCRRTARSRCPRGRGSRSPPPSASVACAAVLYDDDADLSLLDGKTVAILGYGSQGHAHSLNLKDSGVDVVVGLRDGSASVEKARGAGLEVTGIADAASRGDIVMVLLPDEKHGEVWRSEIADGVAPGNLLLFGHGFSIHFNEIDPPAEVDVGLVAPKGPGHLVRRQYVEARGVPGLIAIQQDATGKAKPLTLAYARGIGCTRAGVIETTFKDETETDLFGEQAVLCGGVSELVKAGYETLVEAGYDPKLAYFECLHELKLIVDLMYEKGITGMRYSISNTAEYGDLTRGKRIIGAETRQAMKDILGEIQSGEFAREWIAENRAGQENFQRMRKEEADHQVEREGKELRSMMDWIETEF